MVIQKGVSVEELSKRYPVLYHMAEFDTWASIRKYGLLSTTALLDLFEIDGKERSTIEKKHRPASVEIANRRLGKAVVRDQGPMSDGDLKRCLIRLAPTDWYQILNRHVFFWPTWNRLLRMLNAKTYKSQKHTVLTVNTASLLEAWESNVRLTALNSGCTRPRAWPRGRKTFMAMKDYPFEARRRNQGLGNALAEVAIQYSVPDIQKHVIAVDHMLSDQILESVYRA
jgi:hypothetical protein